MKRSIWRILEVVAVAGSRAVERVAASGGVSFGEEGEEAAGAGADVGWWAQIKPSLARDGFCR